MGGGLLFPIETKQSVSMSGCLLTGFDWPVLEASALLHTGLKVLLIVEMMTEQPGAADLCVLPSVCVPLCCKPVCVQPVCAQPVAPVG